MGSRAKVIYQDAAPRVHGCWTGTQAHLPGSAQVPAILITAGHLACIPVRYRLQQTFSLPTWKDCLYHSRLMWILLPHDSNGEGPSLELQVEASIWHCWEGVNFTSFPEQFAEDEHLNTSMKEKTCGAFPLLSGLELWTDQRPVGWGKQGEAGAGRHPGG